MNTQNIKLIWTNLLGQFQIEGKVQEILWAEIEENYSGKNRYYHNLIHLAKMLEELDKHEANIENKQVILISIFYHDLIYKPIRKDNELKSAERMKHRLNKTNIDALTLDNCYRQIIQTKTHQIPENSEIDDQFLLDFDLEVLSREWNEYKEYTEQIRKEYWMYPKPLYKKGRKSAMLNFLKRDTIYYTEFYRDKKEKIARMNIKREIEELL